MQDSFLWFERIIFFPVNLQFNLTEHVSAAQDEYVTFSGFNTFVDKING